MEQAIAFPLAQLGYQKLRKEQPKVLNAFVGGRDSFAALPTGYGKSLCFALFPHIGRTAWSAALDNLRRFLTVTDAAATYTHAVQASHRQPSA